MPFLFYLMMMFVGRKLINPIFLQMHYFLIILFLNNKFLTKKFFLIFLNRFY